MADAIRASYSDIFTLKEKPTQADSRLIEGKFLSTHNATKNTAKLMANTFFALKELADLDKPRASASTFVERNETEARPNTTSKAIAEPKEHKSQHELHYNIQIHLPATKDIEVFDAIFKSLKEHLLD